MTKAELIEKVAKEAGAGVSKKQVSDIVESTFATLEKAIRKDKRFHLPGFGTWAVKKRQARKGRNPKTGEVVMIAPTRTVAFKPAPTFKASL
jgi:DNA-binding protein HU-beta